MFRRHCTVDFPRAAETLTTRRFETEEHQKPPFERFFISCIYLRQKTQPGSATTALRVLEIIIISLNKIYFRRYANLTGYPPTRDRLDENVTFFDLDPKNASVKTIVTQIFVIDHLVRSTTDPQCSGCMAAIRQNIMAPDIFTYCHYLPGLCADQDMGNFINHSDNWKNPENAISSSTCPCRHNNCPDKFPYNCQPKARKTSAGDDASSSTITGEIATHPTIFPNTHYYQGQQLTPAQPSQNHYYSDVYNFAVQDPTTPKSRANKYTIGGGKRIGRPRIDRRNTKCEKCGVSVRPTIE